jgi:predicted acylesterase/phospholipase RssA
MRDSELEMTMAGGDSAALVLAGAVAKGAFAVGAATYVARQNVPIRRIAATSSGALTAAVLGAGMATGRLAYAAEVATDLWLDHGTWSDIAHVTLGDWFHASGLLDTSNIASLVREGIRQVMGKGPHAPVAGPSKTTLIATRLVPEPSANDDLPIYEQPIHFEASDYLDESRWDVIAQAAAASATFPAVFAPTMIHGQAYVDGGAVNNAPISHVLDDPAVRTVVVVTSEASAPDPGTPGGGADLIGKLADILINERVSVDIASARKTNALLRRVAEALRSTGATEETEQKVLAALGWREIDIVLIHPDPALTGSAFAAFFDRELRRSYIQEGLRAAQAALERAARPVP